MTANVPANKLFLALQRAGIPKPYIRKMLPDWWTDELLNDPNALTELTLNLSRMFGLKLSCLLEEKPCASFDFAGQTKYKRSKCVADKELEGATAIVHSIAKIVAAAVPHPCTSLPNDPLKIRHEILEGPAKHVSLMAVIDYLWSKGIPTVHISEMPEGLKKMDGLSLQIGNRPVIILSKKSTYQAWHLFITAHELAHCALNHIDSDEILVDYSVGEDSYLLSDDDPEEKASDRFAIALLNGDYDIHYTSLSEPNSAELADAALKRQKSHMVDAGHVILNYGFRNNAWKIAQTALQRIDKGNAPLTVNDYLFQHLKLSMIPNSSAEFLFKVTGILEYGGPQ